MWINRQTFEALTSAARDEVTGLQIDLARTREKLAACERTCERYAADTEWFKMRLNQLERERAALLRTTTGARVEVPEFLPAYDPKDVVQPDQDMFKGVGEDDPDDKPAVSLDMMPKRTRN